MKTPNISLMREYGTDASFRAKTANVQPIAQRMAQIVLGRQILQRLQQVRGPEVRHTAQAEMMNTTFRMLELARMEQAIDNANHTIAPIILPAGYQDDMPIGMTEGMIRMASVIGGNLAKTAGVMRQPYRAPAVLDAPAAVPAQVSAPTASVASPAAGHGGGFNAGKFWDRTGLSKGRAKWKIPALLGAAGLTYAAVKGTEKVLDWGKKEQPEPVYGRGFGNLELAPGLNQYDQPQGLAAGY